MDRLGVACVNFEGGGGVMWCSQFVSSVQLGFGGSDTMGFGCKSGSSF